MASARSCDGLWEMWMPEGSKSRRRAPLPGLPGTWRGSRSAGHSRRGSAWPCSLVKSHSGELGGLGLCWSIRCEPGMLASWNLSL